MATGSLDSTRVFVSGLPPGYKNSQLSAHFAAHFKVTDAHVFPERRIGFVGFADHATADRAAKYFDRSYIRLSKISVDLAKPIEVTRNSNGQAVPISAKRERTNVRQSRNDASQPGSANDLKETLSRKRKRGDEDIDDESLGLATPAVESDPLIPSITIPEQIEDLQQQGSPSSNGNQKIPQVASDNDWLRHKTSRTLDLLGEEKAAGNDAQVVVTQQSTRLNDPNPQERLASLNSNGTTDSLSPAVPNSRLFIRNLAFDVTDEDLRDKFEEFGKIQEAHVVKDARKGSSKGTAFVQFSQPASAEQALQRLDGVAFRGRLLHILPASDKREQGLTDYDISKLPVKQQKAIQRKRQAASATFSWNSLYMNPDAVISSVASRLGVSKSDILDPTSADAAIKQAHAETQLIAETKEYLASSGVAVECFKNKSRDDKSLLLKNFPFGTTEQELSNLLSPFGEVSRFLLPPAGTMAIVQFVDPYSAGQALRKLAYHNIKGSILYLEKAPRGLFKDNSTNALVTTKVSSTDEAAAPVNSSARDLTTAVFVRNLNFATTSRRLSEVFSALPGFLSAKVKTRTDPQRPGEILSMGFGFVEFVNKARAEAAVSAMNGRQLDGQELLVKLSVKSTDLGEERRHVDEFNKNEATMVKIIIKNLPFQASKKDVKALFAPYGQLKTVRVPRKFDSTSRGFGFAEFVTAREAENAMEALSNTHLLGRKLVLEFARSETIDPEDEILLLEKKADRQSSRINLSKLSGPGRKKFNVNDGGDE